MKGRVSNQFLVNYLAAFLLSVLAAACAFLLLSFANDVISNTLMKNVYPAASIMRDDYGEIDAAPVVDNGGGVQVVNSRYEVVRTAGVDTLGATQLTAGGFTDFLMRTRSKGNPYHYDVAYNPRGGFWLIVTFPVSLRLDFSVVFNRETASRDMENVAGAFAAVLLFYLLLLAVFAVALSRLMSVRITGPLRKLCEGTERLRRGDYSARVDLRLKNEFAALQHTFNAMAERIERETALREQSEDERKKLILDISHDLKNPLASVAGYAELCLQREELTPEARRGYLEIIHNNSLRASRLLTELFELARLESPSFTLHAERTDVCEYLRRIIGELLPALEQAGFTYDFDIPDGAVHAMIDPEQMGRVFHNLADNAVRYNPAGTAVSVRLSAEPDRIVIVFGDDGVGIPAEVVRDIFKPFVRADDSRNSQTGGSGLGLSIAHKIVQAHGGALSLRADGERGSVFEIALPRI